MHVGNGSSFWASSVELYSAYNGHLLYTGASSDSAIGGTMFGVTINFLADLTDGLDIPTYNPSMEPVEPGAYLLRIGDRYCTLYIPFFQAGYNADFEIKYSGGVFTRLDDPNVGRQITISQTYDWTGYDVTLNNSFNAEGVMNVDNIELTIPANGETFEFEQSTFPHTLGAIDQQPASLAYMQRFDQWTGNSQSTNRTISISAADASYTARFVDEYNVTFQNSFSGATGGVVKVNGTQHNALIKLLLCRITALTLLPYQIILMG